jgi:hypothetical protein
MLNQSLDHPEVECPHGGPPTEEECGPAKGMANLVEEGQLVVQAEVLLLGGVLNDAQVLTDLPKVLRYEGGSMQAVLVQLGVAHVPQVADEVGAQGKHHVLHAPLLPPLLELVETRLDELHVVTGGNRKDRCWVSEC